MLSNWASCNDLALVYDSKQKGTFVSARWQRDYSPDLCWVSSVCGHPQPAMSSVLGNFPHSQHRPSVIHIGVTLPVIHSTNNKRWNFRKADWGNFTRKTENSTPLIPRQQIAFEEHVAWVHSHQLPTLQSQRRSSSLYSMYGRRSSAFLQQYEESGDPDIADNLIKSLNAARRDRWEESTSQLNFTLKQEKLVPCQTHWCRSTPSASFSAASVSQRCRQPSTSSSCQSSEGSET